MRGYIGPGWDTWMREAYIAARESDTGIVSAEYGDEYDRWIATHDAEVAGRAWDEACHAFAWCLDNGPSEDAVEYVRTHLPDHFRADRLGAGDEWT